jgi:hypothetical protein
MQLTVAACRVNSEAFFRGTSDAQTTPDAVRHDPTEGAHLPMKRTLLTPIMSLFLGLAPAVLLINPASAQSSGGAQHFQYLSCNTEGVCFTVDTLINTTINQNVSSVIVRTDITGINNVEGCTVDTS